MAATVCMTSNWTLIGKSDKSYFLNGLFLIFNEEVSKNDPPVTNKPSIQAWGKAATRKIHISNVTTIDSTC
jgi:hypothetical protein